MLARECAAAAAANPGRESSQRQRDAGVDEHRATGGHEAGDGLPGQPVDLAGVREAQPRTQAPAGD